jgi:hypothetical protein
LNDAGVVERVRKEFEMPGFICVVAACRPRIDARSGGASRSPVVLSCGARRQGRVPQGAVAKLCSHASHILNHDVTKAQDRESASETMIFVPSVFLVFFVSS